MKKNRKWIIIIAVIVIIGIAIYIYMNQTPAANPRPYVGINDYDLSKLSSPDYDTYNSLPDDAAKLDFLKILESQGKVPPPTPTPAPDNTTTPSSPGNGSPQPSSPTAKPNILTRFETWLSGLFHKKTTNVSSYIQVQPIDENGCDANGFDAIGVKCL